MHVLVTPKRTRKIRRSSILQQTAYWSEVKRRQGFGSRAFDIQAEASGLPGAPAAHRNLADDVLVILQDIGHGGQIGYVPYGPTLNPPEDHQGPFLEALSEALRAHLPSACLLLRYDLLWESVWAREDRHFDARGHWIGPPARASQEIRLNCGTRHWNLHKAPCNRLPADTIFIDLQPDEDALLARMKPKTRYNIRLAANRGVRVRAAGRGDLGLWYDLYRQTCARNRIHRQEPAYFAAVLDTRAGESGSPAEVELLIAEAGSTPLAAMFLVTAGRRATYLFGASASTQRHRMAPYALQWEAIRRARNRGCREYDMFGVAPTPESAHPLHGLYRFKKGFGGRLFHRMGCWDYPLDPERYAMLRRAEINDTGLRLQ